MALLNDLPKSTRERLVQMEELLKSWSGEKITSAKICELTGWKDSLVRHDLWLIRKATNVLAEPAGTDSDKNSKANARGVKNGYYTKELLQLIQSANGSKLKKGSLEPKNVCIVGLGRLGAALLDETLFEGSNYVIKAGFDSNVNRVEILRSTFPLYPAGDMNWIIKQEKITLAVLTVADKDAKSMCDRLVKASVTGIVNMTRAVLKVPDGVKVENVSVITALKLVN